MRKKRNAKEIWKNLKKLTGKFSNSNTIELNIEGSLIHDPSKVATAFNTYFIESINELTLNLPGSSYITTPINN